MFSTLSRFALLILVLAAANWARPAESAPPDFRTGALAAAQRQREIAKLELRLFQRLDFPLRLRQLETEITLTKAELASHKRSVVEYERFTKFKYSSVMFVTLEQARLDVLESELRLKDLIEEKWLLIQHRSDLRRLLELRARTADELVDGLRR